MVAAESLFPSGRSRLIHGDCLDVMSRLPPGSFDLIYVDPPFNTGRQFATSAESGAPTAAYTDRWTGGLAGYLGWLEPRLARMYALLAPQGNLLVHLDWRAVHYVKVALDRLCGEERFRNEIIWHYGSGGRARRYFSRKHDTILWYSRSGQWVFDPESASVPRTVCQRCGGSQEKWNHLKREVDSDGRVFRTIRSSGRLYRYYDDEPTPVSDVWLDVSHLQQKAPERTGFPTQKPEALLRRIVGSLSAPGAVVGDFFCGSGTTLAVADALGRRFVGCDLSAVAIDVAAARLAAVDFALEHDRSASAAVQEGER